MKELSEHPADDLAGCDMDRPAIGFTSNKEYTKVVPYYDTVLKAFGYGYGSSLVSQAEADAIAISRAIAQAEERMTYMLSSPHESEV